MNHVCLCLGDAFDYRCPDPNHRAQASKRFRPGERSAVLSFIQEARKTEPEWDRRGRLATRQFAQALTPEAAQHYLDLALRYL